MLDILAIFAAEAAVAAEAAAIAEAAAVAEAAATAAAAAETAAATTAAAQAATATEAATGIMQAAPAAETAALQANQVAALQANQVAALGQETAAGLGQETSLAELMKSVNSFNSPTSMFGPDSMQLAGPLPSSYYATPSTELSVLPEVSQGASTVTEAVGAEVPVYKTQVIPEDFRTIPSREVGRISVDNAVRNAGQGIDAAAPINNAPQLRPTAADGTPLSGYTSYQIDAAAPINNASQLGPTAADGTPLSGYTPYQTVSGGAEETSSFMKGFNAVSDWAEKHPYQAAGLGYMAYSALNKPKPYKSTPYDGPLSKFRISPDFQGRQANPQDYQYKPRQYASGGITDIQSYAKGKLIRPNINDNDDVGIYRDTDPDTTNLDPLTAAMLLQSKLNKRSYVNTKAKFNKPTPMGTLNFDPVIASAAQGGIMGASNLGGYAAGGNPRLLRGPGDGMSDNIPATINNRQPARLADGEFVVPADVVSHLGNGSTEAGAKKLHEMMNKVRKARTGNQKQGKQINPNRFIPK